MIRTIITPYQQSISINLPQEYVGKRVEIIAFMIEDTEPLEEVLTHFASEKALAKEWFTLEEDVAWQNL